MKHVISLKSPNPNSILEANIHESEEDIFFRWEVLVKNHSIGGKYTNSMSEAEDNIKETILNYVKNVEDKRDEFFEYMDTYFDSLVH